MFHDYLGRVGILLIIIHNFLYPLNQGGNLLTLNNCWYFDWALYGDCDYGSVNNVLWMLAPHQFHMLELNLCSSYFGLANFAEIPDRNTLRKGFR